MHNEDQQLLGRFATSRDEAAFKTLIRRHLGLLPFTVELPSDAPALVRYALPAEDEQPGHR